MCAGIGPTSAQHLGTTKATALPRIDQDCGSDVMVREVQAQPSMSTHEHALNRGQAASTRQRCIQHAHAHAHHVQACDITHLLQVLHWWRGRCLRGYWPA